MRPARYFFVIQLSNSRGLAVFPVDAPGDDCGQPGGRLGASENGTGILPDFIRRAMSGE